MLQKKKDNIFGKTIAESVSGVQFLTGWGFTVQYSVVFKSFSQFLGVMKTWMKFVARLGHVTLS